MSKNSRQIFLIFLAYYGMTCVSNAYFLFGPYYESLGATPQRAGLFLSAFYMVTLFCRLLGSVVMERLDIRRTLIGSALLCAAATAGIALTLGGGASLLIFRALSGIFFSVFIVATVAAQSILLDEKSRGIGFALFTTGSMLPLATVVPLCEWLLRNDLGVFYVWVPVAISLGCAAVSRKVDNLQHSGQKKNDWGTYRELFSTRGFTALLLTVLAMSFADAATLSVASLAGERGVSVSFFMIASAVSAVVIRTLGFHFMSLLPRTIIAAPAVAMMGFAMVGLSFSSSSWMFAFFGMVFGLAVGIAYPTNFSLVGDLMAARCHPKATGLVLLVDDIGWIISPLIYGFLSPLFGVSNSYRFMGLLVFVSASAIFWKYWRVFTPRAASRR